MDGKGSDMKKKHEAAPTTDSPTTEPRMREGGEGEPRPESEPERLARERDEYRASWQRAAADYQNLRRRLQEEVDSGVAQRKQALLSELLLVLDYLDMALATPVATEEGKKLHAGVEATRAALLAALERAGVRPIPVSGRFDPALHESVAGGEAGQAREQGKAPGEIVATFRPGYTFEGRILRPAQVRVAGGTASDEETDRLEAEAD